MSSEPSLEFTFAKPANAALVLSDGAVFFGHGVGAIGSAGGEVCFNTSYTGYQEILTDPSYSEQIITFTFPHIGNVGTNGFDIEASKPYAKAIIIREPITPPTNHRNEEDFNTWLVRHQIVGIAGIDTRALTHYIRKKGPQNGIVCHVQQASDLNIETLKEKVKQLPSLIGLELTRQASTTSTYHWDQGLWDEVSDYKKAHQAEMHIVAMDFGIKLNILRCLIDHGCHVTVVPGNATLEEILSHQPDGVFLSNGPGDPAATGRFALTTIRGLLDRHIPLFGICLGHQLLGLALGAQTKKLPQGHRGANHPVKDLETGKVEITSQNHGFVVDKDSLPAGVIPTHISLFDQTLEGLRSTEKPAFSVQHHPEASPGPQDSFYLFERFIELIRNSQKQQKGQRAHA